HQAERDPSFRLLEFLEAVVMQSKCGFKLFEEKLNLPPQLVELDHVSQGEFLVIGHEDFLNLYPMALCQCFRCRKEEPYLSHGMNVPTFLVHVVRAGLKFRPDPVAGDPKFTPRTYYVHEE